MAVLSFFVNGKHISDASAEPEWTLAWYLREKLGLTGTKLSCEEGQCGSCTVVLGRLVDGKPRYDAVNACILPLGMVHHAAVLTVEALGSVRTTLHPLQERLSMGHGSQCGFCTPGMIMSMYALLRTHHEPTSAQIQTALKGNLCRCTGYRPILEAFDTFTCGMGAQCCRAGGKVEDGAADAGGGGATGALVQWEAAAAWDPSQEPIFPPQLLVDAEAAASQLVELAGKRLRLVFPKSLAQLWAAQTQHGDSAKIVTSGTLIGLIQRNSPDASPVWISLRDIVELQGSAWGDEGLEIGAALSFSQLQEALDAVIAEKPEAQTRIAACFAESVARIGGKQLRNFCSWAGNLAAGSSISDLALPFLACGGQLKVASATASRWLSVEAATFVGRGLGLAPGEIIVRALLPSSRPGTVARSFKSGSGSGTYGDYGTVVNAAACLGFGDEGKEVTSATFAFGGMAEKPLVASKTAALLIGKEMTPALFEELSGALMTEVGLAADDGGPRPKFRNDVCLSFLLKFYVACLEWAAEHRGAAAPDPRLRSAAAAAAFEPMKATQLFQEVKPGQAASDPVGRPLRNVFADRQVTGEAQYVADIPSKDCAHLVLLLSRRASAKFALDTSAALAEPGVLGFFDAADVPGTNRPPQAAECLMDDECIFAEGNTVSSVGEVMGAIVAVDVPTARRALKLIKVEYEDLPGPILTIEDAIAKNSYFGEPIVNQSGDLEAAFKASEIVLEGTVDMGGQEHMYMETNSTLVVPKEGDEWDIFPTSQSPAMVQQQCSAILGNIGSHHFNVRTMRLGGAFGGKCSQWPGLWAALVAAHHLRRPVRAVLSRREDLVASGKRHPCLSKYRVGADPDGRLKAVQVELFMNGGHTSDESCSVALVGTLRFGNCYKADAWKITGRACRTNLPSNTAFRAYGTPQGYFATETLLYHISTHLGLPIETIRERNFLRPGDLTMQNTRVRADDEALQRCWAEVQQLAEAKTLSAETATFNAANKFKKRGLAVVPVRWGIGMAGTGFEQGHVLVHIYTDGTVLLSHGGIEMGQGLNTKVLQVAARVLEIPAAQINVAENASFHTPNPQTTGGSQGSDVHGLAAKAACEKLRARLAPIREKHPKADWAELIKKANEARVNLSATAVGRPAFEEGGEMGIRYYTTGAAVGLAEIDVLTGEHRLLSTHIVMDVGESLNPAVDIGQIEGGFMQGYGLFTTEELAYSPRTGALLSNSAGKYRIPRVDAVPPVFKVALLRGSPDPLNLYSSRGIGEPPVFLGHVAYAAIREAIRAAREEAGAATPYPTRLDSPATAERIRAACGDVGATI